MGKNKTFEGLMHQLQLLPVCDCGCCFLSDAGFATCRSFFGFFLNLIQQKYIRK